MNLGDAAAQGRAAFHLADHVGEEQHLSIAGAGNQRILPIACVIDQKTGILDAALAAHALQIALPALAVGRVGEHEVEFARREGVVGEGGVLRPAHDVVGPVALALE